MSDEPNGRGRGRPREIEKDQAIQQATWTLLASKGLDGLTFEGVAETAGISRTTLYRRFSSKVELVTSALYDTLRLMERDMTFERDPRAALLAHVRNAAEFMRGERGRAIVAINESAMRNPELAAVVDAAMRADTEILIAAMRSLCPGASDDAVQLAVNMLAGTCLWHQAIRRQPIQPEAMPALLDAIVAVLQGSPAVPQHA